MRDIHHFSGKHGPMLIAEIGGNHEGDFSYAKKLVELAIESDVDVVKLQIYTGDTLVSSLESPDRNKHYKRFELLKEQHCELARMVCDAGLRYTSSVWDIQSIGWIDDFMSFYKIGSGDLTAYPILRQIAKTGKPIILSTGLSTESEILETIRFLQGENDIYSEKEMLAVLQCTSMYPIRAEDSNLNVMSRLKELTELSIGYSDHSEGSKALKYATAMGAEILEFHFTDTRHDKVYRDHKVSLTPNEVADLIQEIKLIKTLQGSKTKYPVSIELENGQDVSFRRAVYPSRDIMAGELLSTKNLTVLRPNHGIDARFFDMLLGKKIKKDLLRHERIEWSYIEMLDLEST